MGTRVAKIKVVKESNATYNIPRQVLGTRDCFYAIEEIFKLSEEAQEVFVAIYLDMKNKILSAQEISRGTLASSLVSPREVYKGAILSNAASVIVAHNHPSEDAEPSPEDLKVTRRLVKAGRIIDIRLLDHIVIGGDCQSERFVSFLERYPNIFKE